MIPVSRYLCVPPSFSVKSSNVQFEEKRKQIFGKKKVTGGCARKSFRVNQNIKRQLKLNFSTFAAIISALHGGKFAATARLPEWHDSLAAVKRDL
jgi:hypothetical protein